MQVYFIDRFVLPVSSKEAFLQRANVNRNMIKTLPGFLGDTFYEQQTGNEYRVVTIAAWQDEETYTNARKAVGELYRQEGFDMTAFMQQLNIQIERGVYSKMAE